MKTFVRFLYMQQELPFYRSKTFHRKKIMVMFTAVFLALLFLMGRLVYLMGIPGLEGLSGAIEALKGKK